MSDFILELKNIEKCFFGVPALKSVSFELTRGQIIGLVGENGAGKSTLMNIIGGVFLPDGGSMKINGMDYTPKRPADATRAGVTFIHQELNLFANLSIEENIFIDNFPKTAGIPLIKRKLLREKAKNLLQSIDLQITPDTLIEKLCPGEKQLVEIAKALSSDPKIIIFDEPTTSLTARETTKLFELIRNLRAEGRSIIYISHILNDVMDLADEIIVLRDGEVTDSGKKDEFTVNRMISSMVGRDIKQLYPKRHTVPQKDISLEVKGISQSGIVKDINFTLYKGEVLGVFGLMGSGRTELARILFGMDEFEKGRIFIKDTAVKKSSPINCINSNMSFVTENRREEGLLMGSSIDENVRLISLPRYSKTFLKIIDKLSINRDIGEVIKKLHVKSGATNKTAPKSLSGGNQQKVVIGKWLMSKPSIFIMDEPTRGIDVGSKQEIYSIINDLAVEGTGVLFISSEIEELIGICDRILVMSKGEIVSEFGADEFDREKIMGAAFRQNLLQCK